MDKHDSQRADDAPALRKLIRAAHTNGNYAEEYELRKRLLALPTADVTDHIQDMIAASVAADLAGHTSEALALAHETLELSNQHDYAAGRIEALSELGVQHRYQGELEHSKAFLQDALGHAEKLGEKRLIARCNANLAITFYHRGETDRAYDLGQAAARLYRDLGDIDGTTRTLHLMARILQSQGLLSEAREMLEEVVEMDAMTGDSLGRARSLGNLALLLMNTGHDEEAAERLRQATEMFRKLKAPPDVARGLANLGQALRNSGDMNGALQAFQESLSVAQQVGSKLLMATAMIQQAISFWMLERTTEAKSLAETAMSQLSDDAPGELRSTALQTLARIAMHDNDLPNALALVEKALQAQSSVTPSTLWLKADVLRRMASADAAEFVLQSIEELDGSGATRTLEYLKCAVLAAELEAMNKHDAEASYLIDDAAALRDDLGVTDQHPDPELRRALRVILELQLPE